jgi:hypothetical protein
VADPLTLLAPPIDPAHPGGAANPNAHVMGTTVAWPTPDTAPLPWAGGLLLATALCLAALGWAVRRWWRGRWARDLAALTKRAAFAHRTPSARVDDATEHTNLNDHADLPHLTELAEHLARTARQRQVQAPTAWWRELDAVRFTKPTPGHATTLTRLLREAAGFAPGDRLLPRAWHRRAKRFIKAPWEVG